VKIGVKPQIQLENGYYYAEIIEAEPYKGNWGPCIAVMFQLLAGKQAGAKLKLVTTAMATGRNKTGRLLMAAGISLVNMDHIDSTQLLGKRVILRTQLKEGSSGFYSIVENILPLDQSEGKAEMITRL